MTTYKQVILVRQDLKLPKGKAAAQVAHASVEAVLKSDASIVKAWREEGMAKIVLKVKDEKELIQYFQEAKDSGIKASLITDAGRTVIAPGTKTCVAIGPDEEEKIDALTSELSLL
ncbi:peptidyl-tRNA hydrolase [Candidatus Woesearchaeota archaeon]|jgi:peptidyl-tRNA hydrolase, PTH2 family|nr:peptidyl-tRNA hydrolase [Candidatus Woesearchaeota archaeon]MBT5396697.1 peptidyl-tRNA hydrolase [Candidatus Woesearchaeota archaeon]MBT5924313.1 peptidyl-tRNA hydrolase [Candidatus Woesearchaeota archaeon]MBT6367516.1 peptidyl-tRNA hydrolase [Candidatus Woesearchaeota archaeon]MBT7763015.1 peptidyl-tRNA hydrolase [Candidatus Woesearchaeota archaeon]